MTEYPSADGKRVLNDDLSDQDISIIMGTHRFYKNDRHSSIEDVCRIVGELFPKGNEYMNGTANLSDAYAKGEGDCKEAAALATRIFQHQGYDSNMITGTLRGEIKGRHAVTRVVTETEIVIVDPINDIVEPLKDYVEKYKFEFD